MNMAATDMSEQRTSTNKSIEVDAWKQGVTLNPVYNPALCPSRTTVGTVSNQLAVPYAVPLHSSPCAFWSVGALSLLRVLLPPLVSAAAVTHAILRDHTNTTLPPQRSRVPRRPHATARRQEAVPDLHDAGCGSTLLPPRQSMPVLPSRAVALCSRRSRLGRVGAVIPHAFAAVRDVEAKAATVYASRESKDDDMLPNYPHDIESGTHITSVVSNTNSTMSYSTNGGRFIKKTSSEQNSLRGRRSTTELKSGEGRWSGASLRRRIQSSQSLGDTSSPTQTSFLATNNILPTEDGLMEGNMLHIKTPSPQFVRDIQSRPYVQRLTFQDFFGSSERIEAEATPSQSSSAQHQRTSASNKVSARKIGVVISPTPDFGLDMSGSSRRLTSGAHTAHMHSEGSDRATSDTHRAAQS
eukprot:CAMPEP_0114255002 /NCGR_PEP_ID=MMETSP0058-20121206/17313_1 /TAXON_ID=36894 /ORGANISM="Pyramimonas parkeae, CCMP726" /LENGTH=410 /DNA_ID=CAMNT_0001369325 /DNA_START=343 /DNA_END=1575 /DNA_ORIENTATION=+